MKRVATAGIAASLLCSHAQAAPTAPEQSPLVRALKDEIQRSFGELKLPDSPKPYFVQYTALDQTDGYLGASFGAILAKHESRSRYIRADFRLGTRAFDNTNFGSQFEGMRAPQILPLDDDYAVIRRTLWHVSDSAYKSAAEGFATKTAALKNQTAVTDDAGDFTVEAPVHVVVEVPSAIGPLESFEPLVRKLSLIAKDYPEIQESDVTLHIVAVRQTVVTTEGTLAIQSHAYFDLYVPFSTQADDGMDLKIGLRIVHTGRAKPLSEAALSDEAKRVAAELMDLREARPAEDYTGPVLFEGLAAPEIVSTVLAPNLLGTPPRKTEANANSFLKELAAKEIEFAGKVGRRVLPAAFSVEDDPTIDRIGDLPLVGTYSVDDEGILASRVVLVENGMLKGFAMSRTPRKGFDHSNGHGRSEFSMLPKAAIGNLIVSSRDGLSAQNLRKRLLDQVKAEHLPFGIIIRKLEDDPSGGYAAMLRSMRGASGGPAATVTVKLLPNGTEELMRGAQLGLVSVAAFEDIIAAGREPVAMNATSGASSSVVAPALLFKRIELKKPTGSKNRVPALKRPAP